MAIPVRICPMGMINRNVRNAAIPFINPPEIVCLSAPVGR
jgi:hypothetical protein